MEKIYFFVCLLFGLPSIFADAPPQKDIELDYPQDIGGVIYKQYGESFSKEVEFKEKTEEQKARERKRKLYQAEQPKLTERNKADILLKDVLQAHNESFMQYLKNIGEAYMDIRPLSWRALRMFVGSANDPSDSLLNKIARPGAGQIEKCMLAVRFVHDSYDLQYLKKEQKIIRILSKNPALIEYLEAQYNCLKELEDSLLAFRDKKRELDPLRSKTYIRILSGVFPNDQGRFSSAIRTEFTRRFILDFYTLFMMSLTNAALLFGGLLSLAFSSGLLDQHKNNALYKLGQKMFGRFAILFGVKHLILAIIVLIYTVGACALVLYVQYNQYKMYRDVNKYIRGRLGDIQEFFEIVHKIDAAIRSNPELEALCKDKLHHTRMILSKRHTNPMYNELSHRFQNNDFRNWGLFLNSAGKLMTTLTMIQENIEMLDPMFVEVGGVSTSVALARLVLNPDGNKNGYEFVELLSDKEQPQAYLKLKGGWHPLVDPNVAVPNDVDLTGNKSRLYAITGSNGHGKTTLELVPAVAALLKVIAPAKKASMTPIAVLFIFKDPQDDPSIKESLYIRELKFFGYHEKLIQEAHAKGLKTLSLYDEVLRSTNPIEANSLLISSAEHLMEAPNSNKGLHVYSMHDQYLIDFMEMQEKNKKPVTLVHVETIHGENGMPIPTFKLRPGKAPERDQIAIRLYRDKTGNNVVADRAERYKKLIKKKQAKVDFSKAR